MKAQINVIDEQEAEQLRAGLKDPSTRALVKVIGILLPLNDRQRADALNKVCNELEIDL